MKGSYRARSQIKSQLRIVLEITVKQQFEVELSKCDDSFEAANSGDVIDSLGDSETSL